MRWEGKSICIYLSVGFTHPLTPANQRHVPLPAKALTAHHANESRGRPWVMEHSVQLHHASLLHQYTPLQRAAHPWGRTPSQRPRARDTQGARTGR